MTANAEVLCLSCLEKPRHISKVFSIDETITIVSFLSNSLKTVVHSEDADSENGLRATRDLATAICHFVSSLPEPARSQTIRFLEKEVEIILDIKCPHH